ncbi:MAG: alanine--tRNA ligase [Candidatus Omnitrophota bacterium]
MKVNELRKRFLHFFSEKHHTIFPSDSLVPDDPTVLFTSAGMNQFKPYFLGEKKDTKRAASCQKCLRTGDLDQVGKTASHHTFFEMLGNFSFGDYFKKEAIEFAWEFILKHAHLNERDIWISVYHEDQEAYKLWQEHIGVSSERIVKLGADKNFWPASAPTLGPNGPCGPCSEIFFDRGKDIGCGSADCSPACDCGRFVEFWNLVFTQFNRIAENTLEPLPQKNIDTGMGLERMAAILQQKTSNFEIDTLQPVVGYVQELLKIKTMTPQAASSVYAIVDHARAAAFAIGDGVIPSNEERGYVVRKIIRKALSNAHTAGYKQPFLYTLVALFAEYMSEPYPDMRAKKDTIVGIIKMEEEKFIPILEEIDPYVASRKSIAARELFYLYDTKGFPLEAIEASAALHGTSLSFDGFDQLRKDQQERSRKKSMFDKDIFKKGEFNFKEVTDFIGYDYVETEAEIVRILNIANKDMDILKEGEEGFLLLDRTPFYPEGGGQLCDNGYIKTKNGEFVVEEVLKVNETIIHKGTVIKGDIGKVQGLAAIDRQRRQALQRAHTATHLLQAALRKVLGNHIMQQGSLVDVDKFRFDFTHGKALSEEELMKVGGLVNEYILRADIVKKAFLNFEEAKQQGALAFFKDKYKNEVRMVSIADYSKELCAGTHANNTSEIGVFAVLSEASISSGVRRIEALVGKSAYQAFQEAKGCLRNLERTLKCGPAELEQGVSILIDEVKKKQDKIAVLEKEKIAYAIKDVLAAGKDIGGTRFIGYEFCGKDYAALLYLCDVIKKELRSFFLFAVSAGTDKTIFVCAASDDVVGRALGCDGFVAAHKNVLSLKGGGKKHLVQGVVLGHDKTYISKVETCFIQYSKT